jgi:hypothetical protein
VTGLVEYYSSGVNLNGGEFGAYRTPTRRHRGQDMSHSSKPGTVGVPALHAGRVVAKLSPSASHGFGYGIIVRSLLDGMEFDFTYAHGPWASQQAIGEWIPQGKVILHEGNSGATSGSCCHIEQQRVGGGFLDPLPEIRRVAAGRVTGTTAPAPAAPAPAAPAPVSYPIVSAALIRSIGDVRGLQMVARKFGGYSGRIDNDWGPGSTAGFDRWVRGAHGTIAQWLRRKYGYVGDDRLGPVMTAALQRANAANFAAFRREFGL